MDSQVQKSIFGLFCQCLYSYQNKRPRGARVQNHSTITHGYLKDVTKTRNGEWGMGNGEWGMGNGEWGMGNGEWEIENGKIIILYK